MNDEIKEHLKDAIRSMTLAKGGIIGDLKNNAEKKTISELEGEIGTLRRFDDIVEDIKSHL